MTLGNHCSQVAGGLALLAAALAACAVEPGGSPSGVSGSGTTMVVNAEVYTVDPSQPTAEALAYDAAGVIIAVGPESDVRVVAGADATVIDAGNRTVLPGFQDVHLHVPEAGINEGLCLLDPGLTLDEYADDIADCADEQAGDDWVRAAGASLFDLRGTYELPIDVLDDVVPDRPALILDDLGHAALTNTLGMEAAGISDQDPDPQGGVLHRDPASGELTGLLLEDAQQPVRTAARLDADMVYDGLLVALDELARNGITSVSDAGGYWQQGHPEAWQRALDEGTLTVRASNSLYVYPSMDTDEQIAELEERFADDPDSLLRFNTAKVYVDGILDLGTAALLDPYATPVDPEFPTGFSYFQPNQLQEYVNALHQIGYRINFHVIGDAATRTALDAVEAIDAEPSTVAGRRHRLTHVYLVDPTDVERFAELGVIADFQAGEEAVSTNYHEYLSEFIGDRAEDLIPVAVLLDAEADVTLSSDWDADLLSPFGIIERAVTRGTNAVPTVERAIELVTIDAAYTLGHDATTGSITVGKQADYIIIDQNPLAIDPFEIDQTEVVLTVVGGREVYRSPDY